MLTLMHCASRAKLEIKPLRGGHYAKRSMNWRQLTLEFASALIDRRKSAKENESFMVQRGPISDQALRKLENTAQCRAGPVIGRCVTEPELFCLLFFTSRMTPLTAGRRGLDEDSSGLRDFLRLSATDAHDPDAERLSFTCSGS